MSNNYNRNIYGNSRRCVDTSCDYGHHDGCDICRDRHDDRRDRHDNRCDDCRDRRDGRRDDRCNGRCDDRHDGHRNRYDNWPWM